jgi:2-aminoadipate transaminase
MNPIFSDRIHDVPRSFIRDILKVAISTDIISFAGGLPNRDLFPIEALKQASIAVFDKQGKEALQYAPTDGYQPLREYLAKWYKENQGLDIDIKNILITSGSQQGLDLLGKIFLNDHENLLIEEPGYLGAIQAFSMFRPRFTTVPLLPDGPDLEALENGLKNDNPRLFYTVPNFQNPSGLSYSLDKRKAVAELVKGHDIFIIEDDPYGQLRYSGQPLPGFSQWVPDQTIMLGTFSKTVVPSFRIGWVVAPDAIIEKLEIAKQAADLHTNYFTQMVLHEYLINHKPEQHIERIREVYGKQCKAMIRAIKTHMPKEVEFTEPEGGMFLWITLPNNLSSLKLFEKAIQQNVAFVPGNPFYIGKEHVPTMRLNFSCVDEGTIEIGIKRLADVIGDVL